MKKQIGCWVVGCILAAVLAFTALPVFGESTAEEETVYTCDGYSYVLQKDGTAVITDYGFRIGELREKGDSYAKDEYGNRVVFYLPEELDGHPVTGVAANAFRKRWNMYMEVDVFIPNSIIHIDPKAFEYTAVHRFLVAPNHPMYMVQGDALLEKESMRMVGWTGPADNLALLETLTIPEGVRVIGSGLFSQVSAKEIHLPESLESIEKEAFYQAGSVEKIHIPDGVKIIGEAAFYECFALEEVKLPQGLKKLGSNAFHSCVRLEEVVVPGSVEKIGAGAFAYCILLKQAQILPGVEVIGDGAFFMCSALEEMILPSSVKQVRSLAFCGCENMLRIHLPEGLEAMGVVALGGCGKLTEITLPNSLTEMDRAPDIENIEVVLNCSFLTACDGLKQIIVSPDHPVFAVQDGALIRKTDNTLLAYPDSLETEAFTVPEGVKAIGANAFSNNQYLKTVVIPEGVITIEIDAFFGCKNLQTLTIPLTLNSRLTKEKLAGDTYRQESEVIYDCEQLNTIYITSGLSEADYQENEAKILQLLDEAESILKTEMEKYEKEWTIPYVLTEERYKFFTEQMENKGKRMTSSSYSKVSRAVLERLTPEQREAYLSYCPALASQSFYFLKNVKDGMKESLQQYFAEVGYTYADYEADLKNISPEYIHYRAVGDVEKKNRRPYSDEKGRLMQPYACIINEDFVCDIMPNPSQNDSLQDYETDKNGLPWFKTYFREKE